jgi:hypothetical protein
MSRRRPATIASFSSFFLLLAGLCGSAAAVTEVDFFHQLDSGRAARLEQLV